MAQPEILKPFILSWEGGYVNHPNDKGGATNKGITIGTFRCIGEAAEFFILCTAIYAIGRLKGQMTGAVQCVSFITYTIIYFYSTNVLKNLKQVFRRGTAPWSVVSFLYYVLRFEFIKRIPLLSDYLNIGSVKTTNDDAEG